MRVRKIADIWNLICQKFKFLERDPCLINEYLCVFNVYILAHILLK